MKISTPWTTGAEAETPIADIPRTLAFEAQGQWQTIRHAQLIERLTQFRIDVEVEAEMPITQITTDLGLALADVAEALGITDPEDLLQVLGAQAYLAIYVDPIPYRPAHPPLHKVQLLLARLRDTWTGKWADAFPTAPPA